MSSRSSRVHSSHSFLRGLFSANRAQSRQKRRTHSPVAALATHAGGNSELLESRVLLSGVNDDPTNSAWQQKLIVAAKDDVLTTLAAIEDFAAVQNNEASLRESLDVVGVSLNSLLNGSAVNAPSVLTEALSVRDVTASFLNQYTFVGDDLPTVHALAVVIDDAIQPFGGRVDVDLNAVTSSNRLDLRLLIDYSNVSTIDVAIPSTLTSRQQDLDISGQNALNVSARLQADVGFRVDLGNTVRDVASLHLEQLDVTADFGDSDLAAAADYHFVNLSTDSGTSTGTASVRAALNDPSPETQHRNC